MPSKKKKYNARFPAGRIKKIMQSDDEIGKVAQAVPVIISKTLELFIETLLSKSVQITNARNSRTLSTSHMKQCIMAETRFDFLRDLVRNVPDISAADEPANVNCSDSNGSSTDVACDLSTNSSSTNATAASGSHKRASESSELKTDIQDLNSRRVVADQSQDQPQPRRGATKRAVPPATPIEPVKRRARLDNRYNLRIGDNSMTTTTRRAQTTPHTAPAQLDNSATAAINVFDFGAANAAPVISIDFSNTAAAATIRVSTTPLNLVSLKPLAEPTANASAILTANNNISSINNTNVIGQHKMDSFLQLDEDYDDI